MEDYGNLRPAIRPVSYTHLDVYKRQLEGYRAAQDNGVGNEYFQMRMEADQDKPGENGYGSISSTEMKDWLRRQELGLDKQAALWKTMATYDQQYDYATAQRQGVGDLYVDLLLNADQLYGDCLLYTSRCV